MSHDLSSSFELEGQLLLAVPSLRDPNFSKAVVFMAAHSAAEGAFGYILNRPLGQRVADLMPDQDLGSLAEVPVYIGGPVSTDKLAFASLGWDGDKRALLFNSHLSVLDAQHEMSMGRLVRGFVGYSGWSEGQLEKEMTHRSWITTTPDRAVVTHEEPTTLWDQLLQNMGPLFRLMAKTPDNVSLN